MRVATNQGRSAVTEQVCDRAFGDSFHSKTAGERMPQGVPDHVRQPQVLHGRQIVPTVKIPWIGMSYRILAWKNPNRKLPAVEATQKSLGLFVQTNVLNSATLSGRQRQDAMLQVHVLPPQTELFKLAHAGQNGEAYP